ALGVGETVRPRGEEIATFEVTGTGSEATVLLDIRQSVVGAPMPARVEKEAVGISADRIGGVDVKRRGDRRMCRRLLVASQRGREGNRYNRSRNRHVRLLVD